jgi:hypothetical protein
MSRAHGLAQEMSGCHRFVSKRDAEMNVSRCHAQEMSGCHRFVNKLDKRDCRTECLALPRASLAQEMSGCHRLKGLNGVGPWKCSKSTASLALGHLGDTRTRSRARDVRLSQVCKQTRLQKGMSRARDVRLSQVCKQTRLQKGCHRFVSNETAERSERSERLHSGKACSPLRDFFT